MIDKIVRLEQVTFLKIFTYVLKGLTALHLLTFILVFIIMMSSYNFNFLLNILFVYVSGILLSITLHEYAHLWWLKKFTTHSEVNIIVSKTNFSIKPVEKIKGTQSIAIACAGPTTCIIIALILLFVRIHWFEHNTILLLLILSYGIHVLSFWLLLGDGLMIVKGIIQLLEKDL